MKSTLTPGEIMALRPCEEYTLEYVTELFNDKESLTYLEILNLNTVPHKDILWLFCREGVLSDNTKSRWIETIVTRAIKNYALNCGVEAVEKWAENWLSGVDRSQNAADAIMSRYVDHNIIAASYATAAAARAATVNAYTNINVNVVNVNVNAASAYAAALSVADHCAGAAYAATAAYYAANAEYRQQIADLIKILEKEEE